VAQRATPTVRIGRATVTLPPGAFLQATALGEETLARLVLEHVGSAKAVADLFAGVGPFALRLAERARVLAADSDAGAIDALRRAGAATSGLVASATAARRRPSASPCACVPVSMTAIAPPTITAALITVAITAGNVPSGPNAVRNKGMPI